jgi:hypothetical protein
MMQTERTSPTGQAMSAAEVEALRQALGLRAGAFDPSQPRDKEGQWTSGGSGVGAKFAGAPVQGSKQWLKARQKDYETDRDFRTVADAVSLLAQGSGWGIVRASREAAGDPVKVEKGVRNPFKEPLSQMANPMSDHKTYFEGQGKGWSERADAPKNEATVLEAGRLLNKAVDEAPQLRISMYRGLHIHPYDTSGPISKLKDNPEYVKLERLKPGSVFSITGVQSFTTDKQIAKDFSKRQARGQPGYEANRREEANYGSSRRRAAAVVVEIQPGARGLPIASLSPWKQREVLTRGEFKVVDVVKTPYGHGKRNDLHITVKQRG